jgi:hypothetical protein
MTNFLGIRTLWFGEGALITPEDEHSPEHLYVSILDELKEQLGNQNVEGKGRISVEKDSKVVTGSGTNFTKDDELKRIITRGHPYVIDQFVSAGEVRLTEAYAEESASDLRYSMGAKLVGDPWEVRLPTNLVLIEKEGQSLIQS